MSGGSAFLAGGRHPAQGLRAGDTVETKSAAQRFRQSGCDRSTILARARFAAAVTSAISGSVASTVDRCNGLYPIRRARRGPWPCRAGGRHPAQRLRAGDTGETKKRRNGFRQSGSDGETRYTLESAAARYCIRCKPTHLSQVTRVETKKAAQHFWQSRCDRSTIFARARFAAAAQARSQDPSPALLTGATV
jgi:hypothetical protein